MSETAPVSRPAPSLVGTLWHNSDFMKLWVGQTISLFGSRFTGLALQFIGAVTLKASPAEMGVLAAVDTAPYILVGLFAGVWVDRHWRRPVLIAGDLGRALLLATIPVAALTGTLSMSQLYLVGFLTGALAVFFDVAYQSYLPTIVDRGQLVEGNSKLATSASAATAAGLSVAGVVIQAITAPMAIVLDVLSYVASAVCVSLIRRREGQLGLADEPMLAQVREGAGVVFGSPLLRPTVGCLATSNLASSVFFALYILFGTRELGLGPAALGLVYGIGCVGATAGGLLATWTATRLGIGLTILCSALLGGLEVLPAALATPSLAVPLLLAASLIGNFGWSIYNASTASLRQAITPSLLLGRVSATSGFIISGMLPLGGLVGGALGQTLGLRSAIVLAACASMLSFLWILFSPVRSLDQLPEADADTA
jgi:MFS family permease